MRQTLLYIPNEIFGYPVFGWGILFWTLLLIFSAILLVNRLRKRSREDFQNWLVMGIVSLGLVLFAAPRICEPEGFPIRGYGVFLMIAITLSSLLLLRQGRKYWNIPPDFLIPIIIVAIIFGIIGARVFHVIEYWDQITAHSFMNTVINIINVAKGGLVVYGSIIGGFSAILLYMGLKKIPLLATFDLFAPALMLGIAIGRIGCLMNGCCFGAVHEGCLSIQFPVGSPAHVHQLERGEVSLGGLFFESPEQQKEKIQKGLAGIKSERHSIWTEEKRPVRIAGVVKGSPADLAGLKAGLRISEIGLLPSNHKAGTDELRKYNLERVSSNADVFNFLYLAMVRYPKDQIVLHCWNEDSSNHYVCFTPDYQTGKRVYPTQIFSSVAAFMICLLLLGIARISKRDGVVCGTMFLFYSVARFILELFRTDEDSFKGTGLSVSQCISVLIFVLSLLFLFTLIRLPAKRAYAGRFPQQSLETEDIKKG
ncbi:MAG: prolipoprotein diacylglyceryl transferase [Planctomycetia bacterium]|nr:prolipoprotein diacylglyceryl transferase [Planctomycetia bacterium]